MRRRLLGNRSGSWDGSFTNITEENVILDTNVKWGVSKTAWATRFSSDRSKFFVGDSGGTSLNYVLNCPTPNIADWTLANQGMATQMRSIHISPDGTKLFGEIFSVKQWTLSTPFNLSTATYNGNFAIPDWSYGVFLSPDGTKMIVSVGNNTDKLYEYALANPFSVLSGVTAVRNISTGFEPNGVTYYNEGNNLLICGTNGGFYKGTVTTPYSIEGLTTEQIFTVANLSNSSAGGPRSIEINEAAKKMYIADAYGKFWQMTYST